ncbi:MAG: YfhO family protein [Thermoanaerobaculia bacterium]
MRAAVRRVVERVKPVLRRDGLPVGALFAFLALYFSPFIVPNSTLFRIGNDFQILYSNYATYLVDAARAGFVPLWNPNEACGYPFLSNPFTAFFYPGRILYFVLSIGSPLYSWYHHQIYLVIGIALLAAGVYVWLRGRGIDAPGALFAAGAVAIGFRIADIYRFPNAVHTAAWMPWVLYAYDRWIDREIGRGFLLGMFALFCLATAGYPYYTVYAVALMGSYMLLRMGEGIRPVRAFVAMATMTVPAALIVLPYYASLARTLSRTVDRAGASYLYSTMHTWSYLDLFGGLFFPPSSISEGWLYSGLLPVLIVLVWIAIRKPVGVEILWVAGLTFAVQLVAAGHDSFLFPVLWAFLPGFQTLRIWPRSTIILLMPLALLMALGYEGISSARVPYRLILRRVWRIALVMVALQAVLWITKTYSNYYTLYFEAKMPPTPFLTATIVAAVFLTVWAFHRDQARFAWAMVALLVTASDIGIYGRDMWRMNVGQQIPLTSNDLPGYYRRYFITPRPPIVGMSVPYLPASGLMQNWYYESYANFVGKYSKLNGFAEFTGSRGRKIFFSSSLDAKPQEFEQWWRAVGPFEAAAGATAVPIAPYNGNQLQLRYATAAPGYLIFVDNNDPDWRATLNGKAVPIESAFGTFKAVRVPAGRGTVTFRYVPWPPYKGMGVLGVLMGIGVVVIEVRRSRSLALLRDRDRLMPVTTSN